MRLVLGSCYRSSVVQLGGTDHPANAGQASKRGGHCMSIFPTKILLATDGSREADLAATTAADLAKSTGSELHVIHVYGLAPCTRATPKPSTPEGRSRRTRCSRKSL